MRTAAARRPRQAPPLFEPLGREPSPLGAVSRHRMTDLRSGKIRLIRPMGVDAIEFPDGGIILTLSDTHVCAFGRSLPAACRDLRAAIESRHALLERLVRTRRSLRIEEFEDLAVFRGAFAPFRARAGEPPRAARSAPERGERPSATRSRSG